MNAATLVRRIRWWTAFFIAGLALSGATALPLETELGWLAHSFGVDGGGAAPGESSLRGWIYRVWTALRDTNQAHPFMPYGTDWLAFAHIVIATAFIGPLRDPVRNIWVIEFGMIACLMVFPLAFICGPIRGIPFIWRLIDCSFGVFGIIPLWITRRWILRLEYLQNTKS